LTEPGRPRLLLYLYVSFFLVSTALGTAFMLTPVHAEKVGASTMDLGLIGTAGSVTYMAMSLLTGAFLDRFEKLRVYVAFNLFGALSVLLLSAAGNVQAILVARTLIGVASGAFWVTAGALTAELSPPELLTKSVGRYNLSWLLGFIVGPFIGGVASDLYGFAAVWAAMAAVILLGVGLTWVRVIPAVQLRGSSGGFRLDTSSILRLKYAYLSELPYAVSIGVFYALLPGHMAQTGISASVIGSLLTVSSLTKGLGFFSSERIVAWGVRKALAATVILLFTSMLLVAYATTGISFALPLALYGLANGLMEPMILDYIAHKTPQGAMGATIGAYEGTYGLGMVVGPLAAAYVMEAYQPSAVYLGLAAVSLLIIPFSMRLDPHYNEANHMEYAQGSTKPN
jgi:MFS family permease